MSALCFTWGGCHCPDSDHVDRVHTATQYYAGQVQMLTYFLGPVGAPVQRSCRGWRLEVGCLSVWRGLVSPHVGLPFGLRRVGAGFERGSGSQHDMQRSACKFSRHSASQVQWKPSLGQRRAVREEAKKRYWEDDNKPREP